MSMDVSIVIPTKNAGSLLRDVLEAIQNQNTTYTYEIICIDSGSTDETINIIKEFPVKLFEIDPKDFGHGKTRNFGASKGCGKYISFITQDALPASDMWLQCMIDALEFDESIAGGFGIHYPYPDCNLLDKRDITLHFKGFGDVNTIYQLDDPARYEREEGYRHLLAYFSDNNSCLRRTVWEKIPYDDVDFAEDQIWARKIIELGYKKVYCPFAAVYHSHNYKITTFFGRYFDEYRSLYGLHKFIIVKKWYLLIPAMGKHIISDFKYIISLQEIGKKAKIKNLWYSLCREVCRYIGGYIGGNYHRYNIFFKKICDQYISQQTKQRRG